MAIPVVREMLRAHAARTAGKHAVMRALVEHDDWHVPAELVATAFGRTELSRLVMLGDTFTRRPGVLVVYSDLETAVAAQPTVGPLGPYEAGIRGVELFARIPPDVQTLVINEGAETNDKAYFAAPHFDNAAVWADVIAFERALAGDTATAAAAFARYDAFFVTQHEESGIVTLTNYPGLANAILLYTAPDCLAAFQAKAGDAPIGSGQTTGEQVLHVLAQVDDYDGVIVNAFGPGTARAFRRDELLAR